jgi:hypothetical protein
MNARIGFGLAIATMVLAAGCSAAEGDATSPETSSSTGEALAVGTFACATLSAASFGTPSDLYEPTNASSPHTLFAFLNAGIAQSTVDVAHAGSKDYSNTAHETLENLQEVQSSLTTLVTWLTTNGLDGTNASASYNVAATMNSIVADASQAALVASISSIGNYPAGSGANAASYAELYSRKLTELANQVGYEGDYCYESAYTRQVASAGSFPNLSCSSAP